MSRRLVSCSLALTAVCLSVPAAISSAAATPTGTLVYGNTIDVLTFDPHQGQDGPHRAYYDAVYEGLVAIDENREFVPRLATEWSFIDDVTVEFQLREGVTFHDGATFDASVVKANLDRVRTIEGRNAATFADVTDVEVVDDSTVRIHTAAPKPDLLLALSTQAAYMISPAGMEDPALDQNPVGTGPFVYDSAASTPGDVYMFARFEDYWDESAPGVEGYEMRVIADETARVNALLTGQVHIATISEAQAEQVIGAGLNLSEGSGAWYSLAIFDREGAIVPELAIPEVRQAIAYAVDRQALVDTVLFGYGTPAAQPYSETSIAHVEGLDDAYTYDPDRARELLAEAGVENVSFPAISLPAQVAVAEAVQAFLADVGITMEIVVVEPGQLGTEARSGNYPAAVLPWLETDPAADVALLFENEGSYNPLRVVDDEVQALADEAGSILDPDQRAEIYAELVQTVIVDEAWMIVLYRTAPLQAYSTELEGYIRLAGMSVPQIRDIRIG